MRATAIIRKASAYLTCFDTPAPANDLHAPDTSDLSSPGDPPPSCEVPPAEGIETENRITVATQQKTHLPTPEEISADIETKVAVAVEAERQAAECRLLRAREEWTNEISENLACRFEEVITAAIVRFREDVAGILTPFVSHEVFERALDDITDNAKRGLSGVDDPVIEISAPADVIDKLTRALADRNVAITARESDQTEARVDFGSTTIETALESWLARLTSFRSSD